GRLDGELVAAVGQPLLAEVEAIEAEVQLRVGLSLLAGVHHPAFAGRRAGEAAVHTRVAAVTAAGIGRLALGGVGELRVLEADIGALPGGPGERAGAPFADRTGKATVS